MSKIRKFRYAFSSSPVVLGIDSACMPSWRAFLGCWALALPGLAAAEAWIVTPELNIRSGYDDNINLTPDIERRGLDLTNEKGAIETNASVALELATLTTISELRARARLDFISYKQDGKNDRDTDPNDNFDNEVGSEDNQYIDVSGRYKITPINDIGARFGLERKYTGTSTRGFNDRISETLLEDGADDNQFATDTDTGVSRVQVRRERIQAEPYWSIGLTQNTRLRLQYRYDDTVYGSGAEDARLVDFTRHRSSVRLEHSLTETSRVFFAIDGGTFDADTDTGREFDELAVRTGYRYNFSPISVVGFNIGARQVSSDDPVTGENEDDTGAIVKVFGEHRGELTRYTASLGRTITPSGNGVLVESDIVELNISRSLSPRFEFRLESEYFGNSAVGSNSDPRSDRDYVRISPMLRWNWTPEWSVNLIYEYQWEDRKINEDLDAADSNGAFVSIVYRKQNEIGQ